ncbi:MAG: PDZ domain-containing protein [Candidatus Moduliflexus flocculans]|nr:PDZ domain-containing protein [Candidatus Moduliflexus flocculans]
MALAVPVDVVMDIVGQIKDKGKVERGWLGVGIGQDEDGRTVIGTVDPESPAELAKLQPGDVVLKIGDRDVSEPRRAGRRDPQEEAGPGRHPEDRARRQAHGRQGQARRAGRGRRRSGRWAPASPVSSAGARRCRRSRRSRVPGKAPQAGDRRSRDRPSAGHPAARVDVSRSRKYIGVYCNELNRELAEHFGVKEGTGLLISRLTEDGPAAKAKVRVGDVIVTVDGKRVETVNELLDLVQAKAEGLKIKLEVLRDKKSTTVRCRGPRRIRAAAPFESEELPGLPRILAGLHRRFQERAPEMGVRGHAGAPAEASRRSASRGGQRRI